MTEEPTIAAEMRTLAATLRENRLEVWGRTLDRLAVRVAKIEVSLDEIVRDHREDADNAERQARLGGSNVVLLQGKPGTRETGRG